MDNRSKALIGSWTQAIGTTLSAVADTPSIVTGEISSAIDLWGNVLQATGNALGADSIEEVNFGKIGDQVQSMGNLVLIIAILADASEEEQIQLNIKGSLVQAAGESLSFAEALESEQTMSAIYNVYGNLLEVIGNSMQAIAGMKKLRDEDHEWLDTLGGWVQAVGSVLTLVGTIKED